MLLALYPWKSFLFITVAGWKLAYLLKVNCFIIPEAALLAYVVEKDVILEYSHNSRINNCAYSLELYQMLATLLKELPPLLFCCNLCEFFKNTFFTKHLRLQLPQYKNSFRNTKINNFYSNGRTVILWNSLFEKTIHFTALQKKIFSWCLKF